MLPSFRNLASNPAKLEAELQARIVYQANPRDPIVAVDPSSLMREE
jgi:hypothetical protein